MKCSLVRRSGIMGLFFLLGFSTAHADWVQTNGPGGGSIVEIAVSRNTVFARSENQQLFRSVNNGSTWSEVDSTFKVIRFLAANGNSVVARSWNSTILHSADCGVTWTKIDSVFPNEPDPVKFMKMNSTTLFAGNNNGFYRSTDYGAHWSTITGIGPAPVASIAVCDSLIIANRWEGGTMLSLDNGVSWKTTDPVFPGDVNALLRNDDAIFAATFHGIFRSTDNCSTWTASNAGLTDTSVLCIEKRGNNLLAGTYNGIFRSDNNGAGWVKAGMGGSGIKVNAIAAGNNALFAGTDDGVHFSTDNGATWTAANSGLFNLTVLSLINCGSALFAGTEGTGIYRAVDSNASWTRLFLWPQYVSGRDIKVGSRGIYTIRGRGVYLSTDTGATWTLTHSGGFEEPNIWSFCVDGDRLLLGTGDGLFRSAGTDTAWTKIDHGPNLTIKLASCDSVICAGSIGCINLSTNNGSTWKSFNYLDRSAFPWHTTALAINGDTILAGTEGGGVFLTNRNGTIWENCTTGLTNKVVTSLARSGSRIFAGTSNGVHLSTTGGASWSAVNTGLEKVSITSLTVFDGNLYAATQSQGVWCRPLSEMEGVSGARPGLSAVKQTDFRMPAVSCSNQRIRINFSLSHGDRATVKIFDLSGRETASLVDQHLGTGSYSYSLDVRNISKGCYLLSIRVGSGNFTGKITVFK